MWAPLLRLEIVSIEDALQLTSTDHRVTVAATHPWPPPIRTMKPTYLTRWCLSLQLLCLALVNSACADSAIPCTVLEPEAVQVTIQRLDAGVQTFEAYRLSRAGRGEWAQWDNAGRLLGRALPRPIDGPAHYAALVAAASPAGVASASTQPAEGRAFHVSVARIGAGGRSFADYDEMPAELGQALADLRRLLPQTPAATGPGLWLLPQRGISGAIDVDLRRAECIPGSVASLVAGAMSAGVLITPIDVRVARSLMSQNKARWAFGANGANGYTLFGVVSARAN